MAQAADSRNVRVAVIGGSGLYRLHEASSADSHEIATPYAIEPVVLSLERTAAGSAWFLPRHGRDHSVAPHLVNYRANLWALREAGVDTVIAVNAVGGINAALAPGALVLPDQLIDYSWGREHTYFTGTHALERHVDFTWPYDRELGRVLRDAALMLDMPVQEGGTYGCTQGPRLETAAEIRKMERDGCDIVGMTGMPEAGLARELGLRYACIAFVVNRAAGLGADTISHAEIQQHLKEGVGRVRAVLLAALPQLLS